MHVLPHDAQQVLNRVGHLGSIREAHAFPPLFPAWPPARVELKDMGLLCIPGVRGCS